MTTTYLSFNSRANAEKFIGALFDHGATSEDVSVIARESGATLSGADVESKAGSGITTTTAADFGKGAMAGTGVGMGVGVLAGLASLLVPGVGIVMGAGALASAIAGAVATTAGGALVGGLAGYMRDLGVEGEVPDEFERDFVADHVIVGVNSHVDGVSLEDVENLAEKYHAIRTTLNRTTVAAVPVDIETVKKPIVDPATGETALTTVEVREPTGAGQIETVPVSPVVPIPGTNQVQPMLPREPEVVRSVEPIAITSESLGVEVDTFETRMTEGSRTELVEVRPVVRESEATLVEQKLSSHLGGETMVTAQPGVAPRGDVVIEKTVVQEPAAIETVEVATSENMAGTQEIRTRITEEPIGQGTVKKVTVNPVTGVTEREIIDPDAILEESEFAVDETRPDDPSERFYRA